jgi:hypothetical protein
MKRKGQHDIKIYKVIKRETGEISHQAATNTGDACKQAGWLFEDCFVRESEPRYKPVPDHDPIVLIKLPCHVCPYQWAECKKVAGEKCPCQTLVPDFKEWLTEVTKSHLCPLVGESLAKTDYRQFQKWVPIAQAIKELSPQQ